MTVPERLSDFPWVLVRFDCVLCPRRGQFRLARLAEKYGAECSLADLLGHVAFDCPWMRPKGSRMPRNYEARCGARFRDLDGTTPPPPDLPPRARVAVLRLVKGGAEDEREGKAIPKRQRR